MALPGQRNAGSKENNTMYIEVLSLQPMKQYIITAMFDDVPHCFCFVFAFCLVSLHGDKCIE